MCRPLTSTAAYHLIRHSLSVLIDTDLNTFLFADQKKYVLGYTLQLADDLRSHFELKHFREIETHLLRDTTMEKM